MCKNIIIFLLFILLNHLGLAQNVNFSQSKIDSLEQLLNIRENKAEIYFELSEQYINVDNVKREFYLNKSSKSIINKTDIYLANKVYHTLGLLCSNNGNFEESLVNYKKALKIVEDNKIDSLIADEYNDIGMVYEQKAEYDVAIDYYNRALKVNRKLNNIKGETDNLSNIGMIYVNWRKYDEALEHFLLVLESDLLNNNKDDIAIDYNNIGLCYLNKGSDRKAIYNFKTAIRIDSSINNFSQIPIYINNIGLVHYQNKDYKEAINNFELAINICKSQNDKKHTVDFLLNLAAIYGFKLNNKEKAIVLIEECEEICSEKDFKYQRKLIYHYKYKIYEKSGEYKKALESYTLKTNLEDSIFNKQSQDALEHYRAKFETEKKDNEIQLFKQNEIVQELTIKRQDYVIYTFIIGIILFIVFLIVVYKAYKQKKVALQIVSIQKEEIEDKNSELNQQNEEILAQRDEIEDQKNILVNQNTQITDSIIYAKQIQQAILPPTELLNFIIPNNFILNLPRDIVSGDFFWTKKIEGKIIIVVADCTGHGVPGAFMSMLGIAFLNEIVNYNTELQASEILNELKVKVVESLHQTKDEYSSKDGMDMALCIIDYKEMNIQYAGANNPIVIINKDELTEIKATKMPIGIYSVSNRDFVSHNISLTKDSIIYLFSDGYQDQFGGTKNKKLGRKRFYTKLLEINKLPLNKQKQELEILHNNWKGIGEQIDDILVMGIKV